MAKVKGYRVNLDPKHHEFIQDMAWRLRISASAVYRQIVAKWYAKAPRPLYMRREIEKELKKTKGKKGGK